MVGMLSATLHYPVTEELPSLGHTQAPESHYDWSGLTGAGRRRSLPDATPLRGDHWHYAALVRTAATFPGYTCGGTCLRRRSLWVPLDVRRALSGSGCRARFQSGPQPSLRLENALAFS